MADQREFEFDKYPEAAGHKEQGGCSEEAAATVDAATLRGAVLRVLRRENLTADEVACKLSLSPLAIRPRCSELFAKGLIRKTEERRCNRSGKRATVWEFVRDAGTTGSSVSNHPAAPSGSTAAAVDAQNASRRSRAI